MGKAESSFLFLIFFVDELSPFCLVCWGASGVVLPWLVVPHLLFLPF